MHNTRDPDTRSNRANEATAARGPYPGTKIKPSDRKGRVLLIDDGIMRQTIVRAMLESCGYSVYRSRNDECAIEDYLLAKDAGYPFDCIVMDLYVSYGIGGKETIRKLIEADRDARALLITSNGIDPIMDRFEEHGFQGALAKPFTIGQLQKAITGSLAGAERSEGEKRAGKFQYPQ